eukprot:756529-Hanusia_phi.AAC.2
MGAVVHPGVRARVHQDHLPLRQRQRPEPVSPRAVEEEKFLQVQLLRKRVDGWNDDGAGPGAEAEQVLPAKARVPDHFPLVPAAVFVLVPAADGVGGHEQVASCHCLERQSSPDRLPAAAVDEQRVELVHAYVPLEGRCSCSLQPEPLRVLSAEALVRRQLLMVRVPARMQCKHAGLVLGHSDPLLAHRDERPESVERGTNAGDVNDRDEDVGEGGVWFHGYVGIAHVGIQRLQQHLEHAVHPLQRSSERVAVAGPAVEVEEAGVGEGDGGRRRKTRGGGDLGVDEDGSAGIRPDDEDFGVQIVVDYLSCLQRLEDAQAVVEEARDRRDVASLHQRSQEREGALTEHLLHLILVPDHQREVPGKPTALRLHQPP